ncbi:MAG TPA: hypothetical protein VMI10_24400 [Terriglobales bacterium]|nr:hypothetical protein [Terriglobales bacterium]
MSVSGISNNLATDQLNTLALSSLSRHVQNSTTSNLDLPSDVVTLQSVNSASSGGLNDVHKPYDGLGQIGDQPTALNRNLPDGLHESHGGPVRRFEGTPNPVQGHDPMPPVKEKHIATPNPIQQHVPMPPDFKPGLGISAFGQGQDPMPPVYQGGVSVTA